MGSDVQLGWLVGLVAVTGIGCASIPVPPLAQPLANAFVEVPAPPPAARVEIVPLEPKTATVWIDGAWLWEGSRWRWDDGGWFAAPRGWSYAPWSARRRDDGTLLYANPQWFDPRGAPIVAPPRVVSAPAIGGGKTTVKS